MTEKMSGFSTDQVYPSSEWVYRILKSLTASWKISCESRPAIGVGELRVSTKGVATGSRGEEQARRHGRAAARHVGSYNRKGRSPATRNPRWRMATRVRRASREPLRRVPPARPARPGRDQPR